MTQRSDNIDRLRQDLGQEAFDVLILGGGINGAVAAAALSAKGARVALIDSRDFASGSSSQSSNLAWGGIKYLESGELLLVSKLCRSRNHLMRHYPSSVKEIRFFTTIRKGFRMPPFMVYLGAWFYWLIGWGRTQRPRYLSRRSIAREEAVVALDQVAGGLEYSDCYLPDNDARFVFRFIRSSMAFGCVAANYVEAQGSRHEQGEWHTRARDVISGAQFSIRSKVLINACGPYVDLYNQAIGQETAHHHLFSKGVHLIVDRITDSERVLAFFASDGRLFFVIPMGPKTCIGTTDTPVKTPSVAVSDADRQFILDNANNLLKLNKPLRREDIIAERCGVRPLAVRKVGGEESRDWLKLSRRHAIDTDAEQRFISIFGGKLTDCINVGEEIVGLVSKMGIALPDAGRIWYGEPAPALKADFLRKANALGIDAIQPTLAGEPLSERIWRRYGEHAYKLLEDIAANPKQALHKPIPEIEYTRCELELMAETEMITTLDDFLRRRSKVALVLSRDALLNHPGLQELCEILFADQAAARCEEYRRGDSPTQSAVQSSLLG